MSDAQIENEQDETVESAEQDVDVTPESADGAGRDHSPSEGIDEPPLGAEGATPTGDPPGESREASTSGWWPSSTTSVVARSRSV